LIISAILKSGSSCDLLCGVPDFREVTFLGSPHCDTPVGAGLVESNSLMLLKTQILTIPILGGRSPVHERDCGQK